MALEMQFLLPMKSVMGAILSLILVSGLSATAEESACVKSFRRANSEFFKVYADLERRKMEAQVGTVVGGVVGVGCALVRRTVMGAVGCSLLGAAAGGGAYTYSRTVAARMQRLYDAHRLYQAYAAFKNKQSRQSEFAQRLVSDLGVDVQKEENALRDLAALMEWGSLCEGQQPRSYDEALEMMKSRLHAL